ncbi:MAG TPA: hypothetical protein VNF74_14295 [Terriglobales bacterium]|nr:hypothetical protein [Terriglobales bacterium]
MELDREIRYLNAHREELAQRYGGRYLVIHGEEVSGAYETIQQALEAASVSFGTASVLIRQPSEAGVHITAPAYSLGILNAGPTP